MQSAGSRNRLISIIHAQKGKAHLSDDEYRLVLYGATGKNSCTECTLQELQSVFDDLNIVLERKGMRRFGFRQESLTLREAVAARAEAVLGGECKARLDSFLAKLGRTSIDECSGKELRRVMGFLSAVERKKR
ncbi:MAG: regulatory protein GemA [Treponemataceae bacterium]|nr:regulatory protein GemA [Treponemataceae bacterium]